MKRGMNIKIFNSHAKMDSFCLKLDSHEASFSLHVAGKPQKGVMKNGQRQRRIKVMPTFSPQRAFILSSCHWIECFGLWLTVALSERLTDGTPLDDSAMLRFSIMMNLIQMPVCFFCFFENQSGGMTHRTVTQHKHNAFWNLKVTEKICFTLLRILLWLGFAHF